MIPTTLKVDGVRSHICLRSTTGELVSLLEIQDLATLDRILADERCRACFGEIYLFTTRSGGEPS